ncbi:MAG: nucleotidyltransferase domain-containing protein [Methanomassiliicoccaceae archaeon]|jgi:predicted nucleotidyltransferase|nr:nucleotidyltransferase domain-containing protein [Methanomassiliicoccaceae archaeon]
MDKKGACHPSLEELRKIVAPIATNYGVPKVYLFGSRVRGDNTEDSDYDFCIDVPITFDLFRIGAFMYDLREALKKDVDIVCEDDVFDFPEIREEMLRDRRIVFEA